MGIEVYMKINIHKRIINFQYYFKGELIFPNRVILSNKITFIDVFFYLIKMFSLTVSSTNQYIHFCIGKYMCTGSEPMTLESNDEEPPTAALIINF